MTRARCLAALSVTLLTFAARSGAQTDALVPGQRVRLAAPGVLAGRFEGTVLQRLDDTVLVGRADGMNLRVPLGAITAVQVSRGESRLRGTGKGAQCGAMIVGGAGLALGIPALAGRDSAYSRGDVLTWSLQGAIGGALWGAIIGSFFRVERWDRVAPPARVSVVPAWRDRSVALVASWRR
jgi:hypothetical protein